MANYVATCRSNRFKVKDLAAFRGALSALSEDINLQESEDGSVCLLKSDSSDSGSWPCWTGEDLDEEIDWCSFFAEHLQEGQVVVYTEIGAESLRYVGGFSRAISWTGEDISLDLGHIVDMAEKAFGVRPLPAES